MDPPPPHRVARPETVPGIAGKSGPPPCYLRCVALVARGRRGVALVVERRGEDHESRGADAESGRGDEPGPGACEAGQPCDGDRRLWRGHRVIAAVWRGLLRSWHRPEIDAAVDWYDARREGLGAELEGEVDRVLERIVRFPHAAPPWRGRADHRVALVARFSVHAAVSTRSRGGRGACARTREPAARLLAHPPLRSRLRPRPRGC